MKKLLIGLILASIATSASAQILAIKLKDKKTEKKFKRHLTELDGEMVLLGEHKSGFDLKDGAINLPGRTKVIELWVIDQAKPNRVPYRIKNGVKTARSKRSVLKIQRELLPKKEFAKYFSHTQNLAGLAKEFELNQTRLKQIVAARESNEANTQGWINSQRLLLGALRRDILWLRTHGFLKAAKRKEKSLGKEEKRLREDVIESRGRSAIASVKTIEIPADLREASEKITGGRLRFHGFESRHVRLFAPKSIPATTLKKAIESTEKVIEGFRREFVDPYVSEDEPDIIPEEVFALFVFIPDEAKAFEEFYPEFMGGSWGKFKKSAIEGSGRATRNLRGISHAYYYKEKEGSDYECWLVNSLGHALADWHYAKGGDAMTWLQEGMAYYLCFEYLGRNTITWFQQKEGKYDKPDIGEEGAKNFEDGGQRSTYNLMALKRGVPFADLARRDLYKMDEFDFAKSWSFVDFLARNDRDNMQRLLRSGCTYARRKSGFLQSWREELHDIYGTKKGSDAFKALDELWKAYARGVQRKRK
ncbi:MAG: hypothetical protein V3W41_01100 [Planctomycetota bacterium]